MPLIAIEEHWMLPDLTSTIGRDRDESLALNEAGDNRRRLQDLADDRIATMDAQGIDVSILALTPPGTQPLAPADAVRTSRTANDVAAAAVRSRPSRFRALSTLPMSSPEHVAGELERAADMGHVGTMVYGRSGELPLDDPAYDDFFAAAAELGQPVFIHPQLPPPAVRDASYRGFGPATELALATFGWGWHVEAGTAALRLVLRGTFDRHPELQVVLGHWGEMLLFWADRADALSRTAGLRRPVSECMRSNFFITCSGMFDPASLHHALSVTTADRLLFATDYPFRQPSREEIESFLEHFPSDTDRRKFSWTNAASLYGLDL